MFTGGVPGPSSKRCVCPVHCGTAQWAAQGMDGPHKKWSVGVFLPVISDT